MSNASTSSKASNKYELAPYTNQSLVSLYDYDEQSSHHCGYCDTKGSITIGFKHFYLAFSLYNGKYSLNVFKFRHEC